ncbi:hypothetical protein DID88_004342 [Monilinia fructigena]|uniref:Uncharacterized protein n=1 Tax=Monilinia fructigena TaxID=38457 RepID=A0A395ISJ2_9HELO|nr:hypothetical protein DID88_004342 [Monilinia fructigena]
MSTRTVSTLKFVGSISLGLLTGVSYTLSSLTIPAFPHSPVRYPRISLLQLPHVPRHNTHTRALTFISSWSFLIAFYFLPSRTKTSLSPVDISIRRLKLNR